MSISAMDKYAMQHLHPYFDDSQRHILDEMYYKDFMQEINPNNLPHRDFAPLIKYVRYVGYKGNIMKFFVPNKYNGWETFVQFPEWWDQVNDETISAQEAARLLLWGGNMRLHCGCPSYRFWGFNYILTQLGAAMQPEERFPSIRNPQLKGIVCKHLNRTLKVVAFHLGDIASAINEQRRERGIKYAKPKP